MEQKKLVKKLGAYALAAGAAAGVGAAVNPADAAMQYHNNGGAGWYDASSDWNQDLIMFKMDGTVVTNSSDTGLLSLGQDADSFTFQEQDFFWWGTEEKDATTLQLGDGTDSNVGYVGGVGDVWNVARLGGYTPGEGAPPNYIIGPDPLQDSRVWSDTSVTDTGGLGGWNFYFAGEWPFGGHGFVGLYADDVDGRHYGWAEINMTAYNAVELIEFAFSDTAGMPVYSGGPEVPEPATLGLLALGAAGLLARRKRA